MEEIDAELRRDNIRIDRRQIEGFSRVCRRLHANLTFAPLNEPAIPGKYTGDALSAHVLAWFEMRYGDRLKMDFSVGQAAISIRGDPWRLFIPRVYGSVGFVCDRRLTISRTRPFSTVAGHMPLFNILDSIEDLPDGLAATLTAHELDTISSFFVQAGRSLCVLEEALDRPLVTEASGDLRAAVEHLLCKPSANCGFSKWSSLQFVEKLLKAFLRTQSVDYKRTHDLSALANLAEPSGLQIDRAALLNVQCAPSVRYNSASVSMAEAISAHQDSLVLCLTIALKILGKPETIQWQLERHSVP